MARGTSRNQFLEVRCTSRVGPPKVSEKLGISERSAEGATGIEMRNVSLVDEREAIQKRAQKQAGRSRCQKQFGTGNGS